MSKIWKVIIGLVVIALLIIGWKVMVNPKSGSLDNSETTQSNTTGYSAVPSGNSDAALDQSINSIDAQLKVVDSNSAQVDGSFQDTPVPQTE